MFCDLCLKHFLIKTWNIRYYLPLQNLNISLPSITEVCKTSLVSGVKDDKLTATSRFGSGDPFSDYGASRGKLNTKETMDNTGKTLIGAWVSGKNDVNQYIQVTICYYNVSLNFNSLGSRIHMGYCQCFASFILWNNHDIWKQSLHLIRNWFCCWCEIIMVARSINVLWLNLKAFMI